MRVSLEAMEHYGFVVAMLAFAYMGYSDYSRSGDQISLMLAVVLIVIAMLATYFYSFRKGKGAEEKR